MEVMTALIILALISSSVLVVIDRCAASAADSQLRIQAFWVARENMEGLLASNSVSEMVEYGSSDRYPDVEWETRVETFYEPLTSRMWIQAVCSASYTDTEGAEQTIELTHWLTDLTKEQLRRIIEGEQEDLAEEEIVKTEEDAADYAGVDVETVAKWVENGMPKTADGYYIKDWLDLYDEFDGEPPTEAKNELMKETEELTGEKDEAEQQEEAELDDEKRIGGRTLEELVEEGFPRQLLEELFAEY